jgi:hypothetical protein
MIIRGQIHQISQVTNSITNVVLRNVKEKRYVYYLCTAYGDIAAQMKQYTKGDKIKVECTLKATKSKTSDVFYNQLIINNHTLTDAVGMQLNLDDNE